MPRPPKNKVVEAPKSNQLVAPAPPTPVAIAKPPTVIDVENFKRVRDSVHQRLQTIQELIKSFSQDYLRQTNLLIGEGTPLDGGADYAAFGSLMQAGFGLAQAPVEEKKERKKRTHDPNAPKRPLTPYFLYMQTARSIIASDLGQEAPKGAVQEEGQRRWSVMDAHEKAAWNSAYQYNLHLYNARVHSYKHGNPDAKNMTDDEAREYADEHNIEVPSNTVAEVDTGNDQDAIAQQLQENTAAEEVVSEEEPAPVAKTPKKGNSTRKRKTATPAAEAEPAKVAVTPASPEIKKRKRTSKAAELIEEPKKSGRKKTKSG